LIGTSVSHYLLLERLATGARGGAVYKARDTDLERLVALKILPSGVCVREEDRQRLARDAEAASALEHPNICPVYEVGEVGEAPDGRIFVAMAFLEGETVADKIARGPLKIEVAIDLGTQIASGLARAHERGIVHRGLKPSEVLVTSDGQARITDFGIAALDDRTRVSGDETPTALLAYRSPEQLRGEAADSRADVWALGVILYEMVTGLRPFPEGPFHPSSPATPEPASDVRPGVPPGLDRAIARALSRRPSERYIRVDELRDDLRGLSRENATLAHRTGASGAWSDVPGREVGPYRVGEVLGGGGMGIVYRAEDTRLGRSVALKFLPPELTRDPTSKARFLQEARTASALDHPNVCTIYDVGETEEHQLYLAMPCYDGETLRRKIERGPLPVADAADYALQAARGLAKAHRQGIVHRDVKPANLMVTGDGVVKILDFGIAKLAGEAGLTRTGASVGTPAYMAPEQIHGREVDGRTDLWALGVVLYEMLVGRRPFLGDHEAVLRQSILVDEPEPLTRLRPEIPAELDRIVQRLLARQPDDRYPAADALVADLRPLAGLTSTSVAVSVNPANPELVPIPRRALPLRLAGILVFAALAALGGYLLHEGAGGGPVQATFTRLTEQDGSETFPSLSPDGKYFVYVKSSDIYLQRVGGGNPINLTPNTPGDDTQPAFSPDGQTLAFRSEREGGGGIFLMGATGESVRRLADFGYNPAWSPDGKEIVVATESVATSPWIRTSQSRLFRIDVATGEKRPVVDADAVQPSWSPDGKRIAYWGSVPGVATRAVWTVPVSAGGGQGEPVRVTADSALNWNPVWSPDGRYLYYVSDRGGSMNLWRVRIDEDSGRVSGEPQPVTTPAPWSSLPSLSKDGRQILYATVDNRNLLERIDIDPATFQPLAGPRPVTEETKAFRFVSVSPDGKRIAFDTSVPQEDLFVMGVDGSDLRRLTDDPAKDRIPRWSPDGSRILFYSNRSGHFDLWSLRADGSGLETLARAEGPPLINPMWSPAGRFVACGVGQRNQGALIDLAQPLAKRMPRLLPVMDAGATFSIGAWSPDGRWLAGQRYDAGGAPMPGIFLYSLDTGRYERLSEGGGVLAWLPDGRTVLGIDEPGTGEIFAVDRVSRVSRRILPPPANSSYSTAGVSPDGRTLYTLRTTNEGDIWLLRTE
jgi:serine/threonine protein kinase/Tol biopolymer transport system component